MGIEKDRLRAVFSYVERIPLFIYWHGIHFELIPTGYFYIARKSLTYRQYEMLRGNFIAPCSYSPVSVTWDEANFLLLPTPEQAEQAMFWGFWNGEWTTKKGRGTNRVRPIWIPIKERNQCDLETKKV